MSSWVKLRNELILVFLAKPVSSFNEKISVGLEEGNPLQSINFIWPYYETTVKI